MTIKHWMSWETSTDLLALVDPKSTTPNVIVHVARMVHTPVGSAPSGMVLWQPDPAAPPKIAAFISSDLKVARYFGPNIFAGTPFENAPAMLGQIDITLAPGSASAKVQVADFIFESHLSGFAQPENAVRQPNSFTPFNQLTLEIPASSATLKVNGKDIPLIIPPTQPGASPSAVWCPAGIYSR